jgi:hypothetical protein
LLIRENINGDVNLRVFFPEKVEDEGKVIGPKTFTGVNPQTPAFPLLKIPEILLGLTFDLKDLIGKTIKSFSGIGENHLFAEAVEKLDPVGNLELLDLFCHSRLSDRQGLCGCAKIPIFDGKVEDS